MERLEGTAVYLRHYSKSKHGTPVQLAKKMADNGASWVAIAGPWHDAKKKKMINSSETCRRLADAFYDAGVEPWIWGYPWQGSEERFADEMDKCAGDFNLALLDPELGSNPTRSNRGPGKGLANNHARLLVDLMAERFDGGWCGVSTFGSGVRMQWFPLYAFVEALLDRFPGRCFAGGQTYTEDKRVDPSIADFIKAFTDIAGKDWQRRIQLVPNNGNYMRTSPGKYRSKTPREFRAHLYEFINEGEPVHATITWAENFMKPDLWKVYAEFAELMKRGACKL